MESVRKLRHVLAEMPHRIVACSGGVDSLLLATVAHRSSPGTTVVADAATPAVPAAATPRIRDAAQREGWDLRTVASSEFADERYLSNPSDRCYFCKSHLYQALDTLTGLLDELGAGGRWTLLSGANVDDLSEYRPGLVAAAEHGVRHPFIEAGIAKREIRLMVARLGLDFAELPASPCLASRLYTGTRVTPARLRAVDAAETLVRESTGIDVVRCRIRQAAAVVEVRQEDRHLITARLLEEVKAAMREIESTVTTVRLDEQPYRPGRAILEPLAG